MSHSKACVLPKYLVGGAESGGQDSGLLVTEGRRRFLSLHIGGVLQPGKVYIFNKCTKLKTRLIKSRGDDNLGQRFNLPPGKF